VGKLRIPRVLQIEGERWQVYRECEAPSRLCLARGLAGACHYAERAIVLSDDLSPHALTETFVHELLHALLAGLPLGRRAEERLVEYLDGPLTRTLARLRWRSRTTQRSHRSRRYAREGSRGKRDPKN
jgi:hypothetical protein